MPTLQAISRSMIDRLISEPEFRRQMQRDPVGALRAAGMPEDQLPDVRAAAEIDFIQMGRRIEQNRLAGGELGAIAVACVVI